IDRVLCETRDRRREKGEKKKAEQRVQTRVKRKKKEEILGEFLVDELAGIVLGRHPGDILDGSGECRPFTFSAAKTMALNLAEYCGEELKSACV
ncbi:unnamed protein product, partial [Heterotrigona itama]